MTMLEKATRSAMVASGGRLCPFSGNYGGSQCPSTQTDCSCREIVLAVLPAVREPDSAMVTAYSAALLEALATNAPLDVAILRAHRAAIDAILGGK